MHRHIAHLLVSLSVECTLMLVIEGQPLIRDWTQCEESDRIENTAYTTLGIAAGMIYLIVGLPILIKIAIIVGVASIIIADPLQTVIDKVYACDRTMAAQKILQEHIAQGSLEQLEARGLETLKEWTQKGIIPSKAEAPPPQWMTAFLDKVRDNAAPADLRDPTTGAEPDILDKMPQPLIDMVRAHLGGAADGAA